MTLEVILVLHMIVSANNSEGYAFKCANTKEFEHISATYSVYS